MNYKDTMLDIYSDGGDWEDFEPEIDKMELRIAELEAQLAEAVEVIKDMSPKRTGYRESMDWFEYDKAVRRAAEFLKKLEAE